MRSNIQKVSSFVWVITEEKLSERDILSIGAEMYIEITTTHFFKEAIPHRWATSSKTNIKVQLGFVNIIIERDIANKHVL